MPSIKLVSANIDVFRTVEDKETLIIRGVIDPTSYNDLLVDSYQREIGSTARISQLAKAIKTSTVPDIELGMRGNKVREMENEKIIYLQDPTFIIDGLQRINGGKYLMHTENVVLPRIGCMVHLDTDFNWERERFRILNQERSKLSVNVLLRNARPDYPSVDMLYRLCEDKTFALGGRVGWTQARLRQNIFTALLLAKTTGILHSRFGPTRSLRYDDLACGLDKVMVKIGRNVMRDNVREFFELVDRCFSLRRIVFSQCSPQIKGTFVSSFAEVMTRHDDFWKDHRFVISRDLERKIATFPLNDPEVVRLSGAGGKAKDMLMMMIVEHVNSGKRTRRLTLSEGFAGLTTVEQDEPEEVLVTA